MKMRTEQELNTQIEHLEKIYKQLQTEHDEYIRTAVMYIDGGIGQPLDRTSEKMAKLLERQHGVSIQLDVLYWMRGQRDHIERVW